MWSKFFPLPSNNYATIPSTLPFITLTTKLPNYYDLMLFMLLRKVKSTKQFGFFGNSRWFHVSKGILFVIIIYINKERITHSTKQHSSVNCKSFLGLILINWRNSFIWLHKRKIFNRWNDNIILPKPNHFNLLDGGGVVIL